MKLRRNCYIKELVRKGHIDLYLNPLKYLIGSTFLYGNRHRTSKFYLQSLYVAKLRLKIPVSRIIHNMVMKSRVKLEFLFKRVGGAFYHIPNFLNPKREISHTMKRMIFLVNESSSFDKFGDKFSFELLNFYQKKGLFLQNRRRMHQAAINNMPFTRYLQRTDRRIFRKSFSRYQHYFFIYRTAYQSYLKTLGEPMYSQYEAVLAKLLCTSPSLDWGAFGTPGWQVRLRNRKVVSLIVSFLKKFPIAPKSIDHLSDQNQNIKITRDGKIDPNIKITQDSKTTEKIMHKLMNNREEVVSTMLIKPNNSKKNFKITTKPLKKHHFKPKIKFSRKTVGKNKKNQ